MLWVAGVSAALLVGCEASTVVDLLHDGGTSPTGTGGTAPSEGGAEAPCAVPVATEPLVAGLRNRYDFSGTGTVLCDLVTSLGGNRHGTIRGGAALDGSGSLGLDGVDDYVELPAGMIRRFTSVTLVVWFTWTDPRARAWSRVFDFGQVEAQDGVPGRSVGALFFTPLYQDGPGTSTNMSLDGDNMVAANGARGFALDTLQQIAVVIDATVSPPILTSYVGAVLEGQTELVIPPPGEGAGGPMKLADLDDTDCWLGQSQWSQDVHMQGVYEEFRIYDRALTQAELQHLLDLGPDQP